jgi:hypothetical protein
MQSSRIAGEAFRVVGVALLPRTQVAQMKVLEEDVWVFAPHCRLDRQYVLLAGVQVPVLV